MENDKFMKDEVYEFNNEEIEKEILNLKCNHKELYSYLKNSEKFLEWLGSIYQDKSVGIFAIDECEFKQFWFFRGYHDEHFEFFLNYFNIYFDEEYANREDMEKELSELVAKELKEMVIKV